MPLKVGCSSFDMPDDRAGVQAEKRRLPQGGAEVVGQRQAVQGKVLNDALDVADQGRRGLTGNASKLTRIIARRLIGSRRGA
jgi:hypothetical protein